MSGHSRAISTMLLGDDAVAGTWTLDGSASRVDIAVKNLWGLLTVHGTFREVRGEATVDGSGTITAAVSIDVASLDTKQRRRDEHLRSADFFDVAAHPTATFVTTEVRPSAGGVLDITGLLTIAGQTRPVVATVALSDATTESVIAETRVTVDRTQFGITRSPLRMIATDVLVSARLRFAKR